LFAPWSLKNSFGMMDLLNNGFLKLYFPFPFEDNSKIISKEKRFEFWFSSKKEKRKKRRHNNTKIQDFWVEINTATCCVLNKLNISLRFLSKKKV